MGKQFDSGHSRKSAQDQQSGQPLETSSRSSDTSAAQQDVTRRDYTSAEPSSLRRYKSYKSPYFYGTPYGHAPIDHRPASQPSTDTPGQSDLEKQIKQAFIKASTAGARKSDHSGRDFPPTKDFKKIDHIAQFTPENQQEAPQLEKPYQETGDSTIPKDARLSRAFATDFDITTGHYEYAPPVPGLDEWRRAQLEKRNPTHPDLITRSVQEKQEPANFRLSALQLRNFGKRVDEALGPEQSLGLEDLSLSSQDKITSPMGQSLDTLVKKGKLSRAGEQLVNVIKYADEPQTTIIMHNPGDRSRRRNSDSIENVLVKDPKTGLDSNFSIPASDWKKIDGVLARGHDLGDDRGRTGLQDTNYTEGW